MANSLDKLHGLGACAALLLLLSSPGSAQTDHATTCTGTFAPAGNPHRITTSVCSVPDGEQLTILPGTVIEGANGTRTLRVFGQLDADGADFTAVNFDYRDGGSGTVENSTITGTILFQSSSGDDPAVPQFVNNEVGLTTSTPIFDVTGTSEPAITGNTITTNGTGIRFRSNSGGTASGNTINFALNQSQSRMGIRVQNGTSAVVNNNTINDDSLRNDFLIDTRQIAPESTAQITNNTLCATGGDVPIVFGLGIYGGGQATISGNSLPCGDGFGIQLEAGILPADSTLEPIDGISTYSMQGNITVPTGGSLEVASGLTINGNRSFNINGTFNATGVTINGALDFRENGTGTVENSTITSTNIPLRVGGNSTGQAADPTLQNNNTIRCTSAACTAVSVRQFGTPTITDNTIIYEGSGVVYTNSAAGTTTNNTMTPGDLGGTSRAFRVEHTASPTIAGNTINDDPGATNIGFELRTGSNSTTTFFNNTICSSGNDVPFILGPAAFRDDSTVTIVGNTQVCDTDNPNQLANLTISEEMTIVPINGISRYDMENTIGLASGAVVNISPGVTVASPIFNLAFQINDGATFNADGVTFERVFFAYRAGSSGTIMNSMFFGPSITVAGSSPTFSNNVLVGNVGRTQLALSMSSDAAPIIQDNTFERWNIAIQLNDGSVMPTITGNTFSATNFSLNPSTAEALFDSIAPSFANNTFELPAHENLIRFPPQINANGTVRPFPVPYRSLGSNVIQGFEMFVDPGVAILFDNNTALNADGRIIAMGQADQRVVFSAFRPELANNRWRGMQLNNQVGEQASVFDHSVIEFAGRSGASIIFNNAEANVSNTSIYGSSTSGILFQSGSTGSVTESAIFNNLAHGVRIRDLSNPVLNFNSIFANGTSGINHEACQAPATAALAGANDNQFINANNNYWGSDSGPLDSSDDRDSGGLFNPIGTGNSVSDCVDYDPFLTLQPSIEGVVEIISGAGQTGMTGTILADPLVIEVRDLADNPLSGIEVLFSVIDGDASLVEPQPLATGGNGRAQVTVQLGDLPGPITIAATAADVDSPAAIFMPVGQGGGSLAFAVESIAPADWLCPGDCDGGFAVSIDELITGVDLALSGGADACEAIDRDSDNRVAITELVLAVRMALEGCPTP